MSQAEDGTELLHVLTSLMRIYPVEPGSAGYDAWIKICPMPADWQSVA